MCSGILNSFILLNTLFINTFKLKNMENKELRNALVAIMKEELTQLSQEQREQKKTRKLKNRPEGKSLQSIVDEINNRRAKINHLIWIYRFIRHGRKYFEQRDILSWEEYFYGKPHEKSWHWQHRNEQENMRNAFEYCINLYKDYFDKLDKTHHIYDNDGEAYDAFVKYLFWK